MTALFPDASASEDLDWRVKLSERVRVATRSLGAGVWEWNLVSRTFVWDQRTYELFGLTPGDDKIDLSFIFRCVHAQDRMRLAEDLHRATTGLDALDTKFRVVTAGLQDRHLHMQAELSDAGHGYAERLVGTVRDVTASQQMSEALVGERERLQVTLTSIGDAVIATDRLGAVTFLNPPAKTMTGWDLAEAAGRALSEVLNVGPKGSDVALVDTIQTLLDDERLPRTQQAGRLVARSGLSFEVEATTSPIRTPLGEDLGVVMVLRDTTEAQELRRRLSHAAAHDPLTGLANRTRFEERLNEAAAEAGGPDGEPVLCFIDVDRFKVINDSAGHSAGDAFLQALVELMAEHVREGDTLARLGGDEFGLILRHTSLAEAERRAGDLVRAAKDFRFAWRNRAYSTSVSIGVTAIVASAPAGELLAQADSACYAAKNAGRGRVVAFHMGEGEADRRRQEVMVAADLRQVIDEDRLVLFGQEIVPVQGQSANRYFEVLVRMLDKEAKIIGPGAFIPAAERFSIMDEVDNWILREALQNMGRRIARRGDMSISLNLSANSLDNPGLLTFVSDLLEESPLHPGRITFEVTESAALTHVNAAKRVLAGLRDMGCKVALDDFGTGASSLSYLKHFPVDVVKLDGSFIQSMLTSPVDHAIVSSINDLAHRIGAETVAECVEDEATLEAVRKIGVDYVQGYIFSTPKPLDQIVKSLAA